MRGSPWPTTTRRLSTTSPWTPTGPSGSVIALAREDDGSAMRYCESPDEDGDDDCGSISRCGPTGALRSSWTQAIVSAHAPRIAVRRPRSESLRRRARIRGLPVRDLDARHTESL